MFMFLKLNVLSKFFIQLIINEKFDICAIKLNQLSGKNKELSNIIIDSEFQSISKLVMNIES